MKRDKSWLAGEAKASRQMDFCSLKHPPPSSLSQGVESHLGSGLPFQGKAPDRWKDEVVLSSLGLNDLDSCCRSEALSILNWRSICSV